jgi:hypothetical protein
VSPSAAPSARTDEEPQARKLIETAATVRAFRFDQRVREAPNHDFSGRPLTGHRDASTPWAWLGMKPIQEPRSCHGPNVFNDSTSSSGPAPRSRGCCAATSRHALPGQPRPRPTPPRVSVTKPAQGAYAVDASPNSSAMGLGPAAMAGTSLAYLDVHLHVPPQGTRRLKVRLRTSSRRAVSTQRPHVNPGRQYESALTTSPQPIVPSARQVRQSITLFTKWTLPSPKRALTPAGW